MIDHNIGVTPFVNYEVKKIDFDYFTEEGIVAEFQGHRANQAYYKSGIISPEYTHERTLCLLKGY